MKRTKVMCDFASGSPSLLAKDLVREATMEMLRIDENLEGEKHPLSYGVPGGVAQTGAPMAGGHRAHERGLPTPPRNGVES